MHHICCGIYPIKSILCTSINSNINILIAGFNFQLISSEIHQLFLDFDSKFYELCFLQSFNLLLISFANNIFSLRVFSFFKSSKQPKTF